MAGKPQKTRAQFIPPPIDGLNLIASPEQLQATEARALDNYLIYDSGIRQVAPPVLNIDYDLSIYTMYSYIENTSTYPERMLYCVDQKIYRLDAPTDTSATNITGSATITNDIWHPCFFNKRIFLFNGSDTPLIHDRGTGNVAAATMTGPSSIADFIQGTSFKSRMYIVQVGTTSYWYGAVGAFSGAFTEVDLGEVFQSSGFLVCVFNWTLNQGLTNEEVFCAINSTGEMLVYSGGYPADSSWTLIARAQLPNFVNPDHRQPFVRVSGDVYISTTRGLLALSSVVSGQLSSNPMNTLSRKIKDVAAVALPPPILDRERPFLYVLGPRPDGTGPDIYVLNYERGAWSRITLADVITGTAFGMELFDGHLMIGTQSTDGRLLNIDLDGEAGSDFTYTWKTPFFDFGTVQKKHVKMARVLGTNLDNDGNFVNSLSVQIDYKDDSPSTAVSTSEAVTANNDTYSEMHPHSLPGENLSLVFSRAGNDSVDELNEIKGVKLFFETDGGVY